MPNNTLKMGPANCAGPLAYRYRGSNKDQVCTFIINLMHSHAEACERVDSTTAGNNKINLDSDIQNDAEMGRAFRARFFELN